MMENGNVEKVSDYELVVIIDNADLSADCVIAKDAPNLIHGVFSRKNTLEISNLISSRTRDIDDCTLVYVGKRVEDSLPALVVKRDDLEEKYDKVPTEDQLVEKIYRFDESISKITIRSQLRRHFNQIGKVTLSYPKKEYMAEHQDEYAVIDLDDLSSQIVNSSNAVSNIVGIDYTNRIKTEPGCMIFDKWIVVSLPKA